MGVIQPALHTRTKWKGCTVSTQELLPSPPTCPTRRGITENDGSASTMGHWPEFFLHPFEPNRPEDRKQKGGRRGANYHSCLGKSRFHLGALSLPHQALHNNTQMLALVSKPSHTRFWRRSLVVMTTAFVVSFLGQPPCRSGRLWH